MVKRTKGLVANQSGQAVTEYIMLLAIIVVVFLSVLQGIERLGLMTRLMRPLQGDFARTYQYGHPQAKGFDDGGPEKHPRARGGDNFRLFMSPRI
jgi:Flp pilus assembly pilin Flp